MYLMKCSKGENFSQGHIIPYGNIEISPCSGILNYGQGLFEGLKAYKGEDGRILLFRPEENATRMKMGAEEMCMPSPSTEHFIEAVKQTVLANKRWVPPPGKGSLYVRPLLIGTGPVLGVGPAPEYTFLVYATPVGNYHKDPSALNLLVEEKLHLARPGGNGGVKSVTNYSPMIKSITEAKCKGFSDVLFLDATGENAEEVSASNIFIVKGNVVSTPITNGTILPGITRESIIDLASDLGFQVEERVIPTKDLVEAEEVFCTGTAVVVSTVSSITFQGRRVEYRIGEEAVSHKLYKIITGIQTGYIRDKRGWTVEIDSCK